MGRNGTRWTRRTGRSWRGRSRLVVALFTAPLVGLALSVASCDRSGGEPLHFWTLSLRPNFTGYIEERISAFEAEHPGVDVVWVDVPFDAVERKLIAAAAAGRAPDVVNLSDMMFARFASAGAFLELTDAVPGEPGARYHAGALGVGRLGDDLLALPWYLTTQALIFNEALLAEGGLSGETLGSSWGALIDQARPFHAATGKYLFTQPLGTDSQLPMMLLSEGIAPFRVDEEGVLRADLTRGDVVAFLARWVDLYRDGALPREAATRGFEHLIDVYQDERVAALNTGANFLGRVRDASADVYAVSGVRPPVVGALGAAHIAVMPLCVSARAGDPEMAAAFAWHMTSPESQLAFCRLAPILPSTPASLEDGFFEGPTEGEVAEGLEKVGEARATVAAAMRAATPFTPALEAWPTLRRIFNDGIKRALLEGEPLEEVLADIEASWDGAIEAMNRQRLASGGRAAGIEALPAGVVVVSPAGVGVSAR